ncbi:type VII secretion protein EccB [Amycolatopsis sp. PS_44_ISF1]|uniref:type VII secretion protein EccB n=1 Tax=Amycolatopsis sp. PS_44_ISF1 TaxID=2974917 RepID=UPI0028DD814D|nr:type VII secretion protein EccB [Amycolatopsis sp. PS_44_ISF1]MDT8909701.1 type VII secretion protein EccB [Amycolatopsis sp. PS_44_ISF1]
MPSTPTTKSQVQAYKFVLRRMQSALVRRDAVMLHDPMRTHSRATVAGVVLGVLGAVVFVLVALLSPSPVVPPADNIVIGEQSGTVYVVSGNPIKLTPTFNLASARLILMAQKKNASQGQGQGQAPAAGAPQPAAELKSPTVVSDEQLKNIPRTKLTGIPDGPQLLPDASQRISANWAVCDQVQLDPQLPQPDIGKTATTVVAGVANVGAELQPSQSLLAAADNGKTYLVYRLPASQSRPYANTVKAEVSMDATDPAHSALQLPSRARKASQAFLNAIPEVGRLVAPAIAGQGTKPSADFDGLTVGDVFQTSPAGHEAEFWLITPTGIEKVTPAVADIIRVARNGDSGVIRTLGLDRTKITQQLQPSDPGYIKVDDFPARVPTVLDATQGSPVACLGWSLSADKSSAHTSVYVGRDLPVDKNADGSSKVLPVSSTGPNGLPITGFYMQPGFGAVVQSATESPATFGKGPIQLISDRGIRYGVPDAATADGLGLGDRLPAPEAIIGLLPTGASLNTQNVLKQFDSVPIDPNAGAFPSASAQPAGN